jgi:phosphomannomutase
LWLAVHVLPLPCPTPLLAFAVRYLGAAAGVMITASHNPAADNGYKLYLSDGAQVIPPADAEIERRIAGLGPLAHIPVAEAGSPLIIMRGEEVTRAYLNAVADPAGWPDGKPALNVVYTPMHGVTGDLMLRAIRQAGFASPHVVAMQAEPDPDFPTVAFPNPEEPGALDLALADARRLGAELVLASDPDGDRLAVAVPQPADDWRVLTGDQVGALLGASLLERTAPAASREPTTAGARERLVATTVVSSTLLAKIAAAAGVRYAETLTGFKWIARAADAQPGTRFIFGYEEALGYAVGDVVRDKDGISAALAMLWLATSAKATGRSVIEIYDELETTHGVHLTSQLILRTAEPTQVMSRLRANPPVEFGGHMVSRIVDLAREDGTSGDGTSGDGTSVGGWWYVPAGPNRRPSATSRSPNRWRAARSRQPATPQPDGWLRCGPRFEPCSQTGDPGRSGAAVRKKWVSSRARVRVGEDREPVGVAGQAGRRDQSPTAQLLGLVQVAMQVTDPHGDLDVLLARADPAADGSARRAGFRMRRSERLWHGSY